ncbi:TPA: hypothetical protein NJY08_005054 [Salmonella enterica subsp. enterica serovar Typhi str. AG3]|nr:hypothetical protein [Salmonella enterica subsp. enterica serovar Typhi str. AG3]
MTHEIIKLSVGMNVETLKSDIEITIEGDSNMAFWNHDLKAKAILALLKDIDIKHYDELNRSDEAYKTAEEIIRSTMAAFGMDNFEE